jgi:hypothetical protein
MEDVVEPVLHKYVFAPLAVKITDPPVQKVVELSGVIVTVGVGLMTTVVDAVAVQPFPASVTVTRKTVVADNVPVDGF